MCFITDSMKTLTNYIVSWKAAGVLKLSSYWFKKSFKKRAASAVMKGFRKLQIPT